MTTVERICPNCGTANPTEQVNCLHCGTNLIYLPASRETRLPARIEGAGTAALVLGATALVARAGLQLLARRLIAHFSQGTSAGTKPIIIRSKPQTPSDSAPQEQPDYIVRGRRSWTIHYGGQKTGGSEEFEYRVKRTGRP